MSSVDVKEIISKQGIDSVAKATQELEKGYLVLQDYIVGAKTLNDVLAKSKGMADFSKNADASAAAQEKLRQSVLKTQLLEEKLEQQRATAFAKEEARQAKLNAIEQAQTAKDNAKLKRIADIEARDLARAQKDAQISAEQIANSNQMTDAEASYYASITATDRAKEQASKTNKKSRLDLALEKEQILQNNAALKARAKEELAVKGSLEQRQLALARLQKTESKLNQDQLASPFGQRLSKTIGQLNEQVLTLEKSQGKAGRNVGNYVSGFDKIAGGATKAFGALRFLANVIPGLGIGGLIGILAEPIIEAVKQLDIFKGKIQDTVKVAAASSSEYTKALSDVTSLKTSVDEFNKGTISKTELVNRFNESIGQTVGQLKTAQEVEDFSNKKAAAYVEATYLRAQANAALELSSKKATEALVRQTEDPTLLDYLKGNLRGFLQNRALTIDAIKSNAQLAKTGASADLRQSGLEYGRLFDDLKKKADAFAKANGFAFETKSSVKKGVDPAIQARKNAAALIQIQIDATKEQADIYKEQSENEAFSLESRLTAQERFEERSKLIAQLEAKKSKAEKKVSAQEILAIDGKQQLDESKIIQEGFKKRNAIIAFGLSEEERLRILRGQKAVTLIEQQRDEDLTALISDYQKEGDYSKEAQEKLEADKLEIIRKANLKVIDEQIQQAQKLIEIRKAQGYDTTKNEADLSALILKGKELEVDGANKASDKRLEKEKQNAEKIKEVAQAVFDFTRGLASQIFEGNIANLEREKEIRQKNTDLQLENIAESSLSEKEKADQTAIINAQSEQAQIAIDARIAEQKRKQAVADKAFALAQIAINTAVAISAALKLPVLGSFVIPGIIALGAIQAATVLAQPIPKFALGGTMKQDGIAEFGHGKELRIDPDGRTSLTSDTPQIGFVQKGTRFISAPETKRLMGKPDKYDTAGSSWDISGLIAESQLTRKEFKKSIGKIAVKSTSITEKGFNHQSARMANISRYISRNFGRN